MINDIAEDLRRARRGIGFESKGKAFENTSLIVGRFRGLCGDAIGQKMTS